MSEKLEELKQIIERTQPVTVEEALDVARRFDQAIMSDEWVQAKAAYRELEARALRYGQFPPAPYQPKEEAGS